MDGGFNPPVVRTQSKASSKAYMAEQQDRLNDDVQRRVRARARWQRLFGRVRSWAARLRHSDKA